MHYKAPDNSLHFLEDAGYIALLPAGSVQITDGEAEVLAAPIPAAQAIPISLTMAQARIALLDAGLLDTVESGIAQMPRAAQIKWEFAATVERSDSLTQALAAALGLTDPQLDALFVAGAAL